MVGRQLAHVVEFLFILRVVTDSRSRIYPPCRGSGRVIDDVPWAVISILPPSPKKIEDNEDQDEAHNHDSNDSALREGMMRSWGRSWGIRSTIC